MGPGATSAESRQPPRRLNAQQSDCCTSLQASHPCELVWDHADRPLPVLSPDSRRGSHTLKLPGGSSDGGGGSGFATPKGGGSVKGRGGGGGSPGAPATPGSSPSDRDQSNSKLSTLQGCCTRVSLFL